jgi:hypothetical protein
MTLLCVAAVVITTLSASQLPSVCEQALVRAHTTSISTCT